ncbi:MAG: HAD family hydrolase [bacterium]
MNAYLERDYQQRTDAGTTGQFLPCTSIEVIRKPAGIGTYQHVLFDFDGTLSLIREGWPEIMIPMMVELLLATPNHENREELENVVREYVMRLTGKQTIYQMIQLTEEIKQRGGTPSDPLVYKQMYADRLMARIHDRREALRKGRIKPEDMLVPGSLDLLQGLLARGLRLYLASGTDAQYVLEEAGLLGLAPYFGRHIYGAQTDFKAFSKAMVIERILRENRVEGRHLLGFGDAYVEVDNVKSAGGDAVGVASDEAGRSGKPDPWKRARLVGVGADLIIPDYRACDALLDYLFPTEV